MATRLYLSKHPGKAVTPSTDWTELAAGYVSYGLYTAQPSPAFGTDTVNLARTNAANPMNLMLGQFVSGRLSAQTISGTVKGQMHLNEANAAADYMAQIIIRLVDSSLAHKAVLLAPYASTLASELTTTNTNRKNPVGGSQALTSQTAADGDRIVVEAGIRAYSANLYNASLKFVCSSTTDLPEDETTTINYNPWVEFSGTIAFLDQYPPGSATDAPAFESILRTYAPEFDAGGTPIPVAGQVWPRGAGQG